MYSDIGKVVSSGLEKELSNEQRACEIDIVGERRTRRTGPETIKYSCSSGRFVRPLHGTTSPSAFRSVSWY